ncbi:heavy-metal-associated domain-containing protein [Streptomyces sp. S3(2020)]|uniref:heavy-metal-associated domain-containing protein n=1 Tax=Streptomyces sp. S3(2020) TaxID=2732044 RepID=UPI0014887BAF|nr:heavy-metal-associated domain-containing protein [Streptomyces sp. S3(2020)]NNN31106.1 heavy-metal-associated domain-containing protein [Streptomyces sp. S3(2020)]
MAQKQYLVTGMSCEHCAASITEEVTQVPGVTVVDVDVTAGSVSVAGTDLDDTLLRAAIVEAGYEVTETVAA